MPPWFQLLSKRWLFALRFSLKDIEIELNHLDASFGHAIEYSYKTLFTLLDLIKPKYLKISCKEGVKNKNFEQILPYCQGNLYYLVIKKILFSCLWFNFRLS